MSIPTNSIGKANICGIRYCVNEKGANRGNLALSSTKTS
jgi:hypothetical protein